MMKVFLVLFLALGIAVGIMLLVSEFRKPDASIDKKTLFGFLVGVPGVFFITGFCFAIAFAPRGFFHRNKDWLETIGTESPTLARVACFLGGCLLVWILAYNVLEKFGNSKVL
ncbi:MAG: hypothetical protein U0744_03285 [Gemmataceae bacterium]